MKRTTKYRSRAERPWLQISITIQETSYKGIPQWGFLWTCPHIKRHFLNMWNWVPRATSTLLLLKIVDSRFTLISHVNCIGTIMYVKPSSNIYPLGSFQFFDFFYSSLSSSTYTAWGNKLGYECVSELDLYNKEMVINF